VKKDIHPKYYPEAKVICACGNTWTTGSTKPEIRTEMCSACHPFFTGEQRIVDTAGQVERFERRKKLADDLAEVAARREEKKPKAATLFEFVTEEAKPAAEELTEFGGSLAGLAAALVEEQPQARPARKPRGEPKGKPQAKATSAAEPQAEPAASAEKPQARRAPRKAKAEHKAPAAEGAPDATASV